MTLPVPLREVDGGGGGGQHFLGLIFRSPCPLYNAGQNILAKASNLLPYFSVVLELFIRECALTSTMLILGSNFNCCTTLS